MVLVPGTFGTELANVQAYSLGFAPMFLPQIFLPLACVAAAGGGAICGKRGRARRACDNQRAF